jgi:ribosomal protein S18 acetylase RimI-like enzyme
VRPVRVEPRLRRASVADAALLADFGRRTFDDTYSAFNTPEDMKLYMESAFSVEQTARELSDSKIVILLAELDALVGYAKLVFGEPAPCVRGETPFELSRLYVAREFHGSGVAGFLLRASFEEGRRHGKRTLWLGVWEGNARARAFYAKSGFEDVGSHEFLLGTDLQTDRVLERGIDA